MPLLYHGITSVCSIKVRVGLSEMGLAYDERVLDLQAGDQNDPAYLKLNRDAVVPTLVDDGLVVVESSLILEYLDRTYNGGALMPRGGAAEVAARHWLLRCIAIHDAINSLTFSTAMRDQILASRTPQEIEASVAKMPNPAMRAKRRDLLAQGLASDHVAQALLTMRRMLGDMEAALAQADWMGGAAPGMTDIAVIAYVDRVERLGFAAMWDGGRVGDWLEAMRGRESYRAEVAGRIPAAAADKMRQAGSAHANEVVTRFRAAAG